MKVYKLGCNWGKGKPDFYNFIKNNNIVIGVSDKKYSIGDLVIITKGYTVFAIVEIISNAVPVTTIPQVKKDFVKYQIDYEDWVEIYKGEWYLLNDNEKFRYKLQQGIAQVQQDEIINKTIKLYKTKIIEKMIKYYKNILLQKKQIILQGAPGTGKTYMSAAIALSIVDNNFQNYHSREEIMKEYKKAIKNGFINFTTFHQSLDYEEFIEGIKPSADNDNITYSVENGLFKDLSEKANEKGNLDELEKAIENFIEKLSEEDFIELETKTGKKFTVTYRGGKTFRVRSIKSQAAENKDFPANIEYIKRLYKNDTKGIYNKSYVWGILNYLKKEYKIPEYKKANNEKKYVLIIDEINRGNISKIFGELITLLENDKRLGGNNEIILKLPYSKKDFGIPSNLFIIGTMNTADRSVGYIDYAVRRRFAFITLKSDINVIEDYYKEKDELKNYASKLYNKVENLFSDDNLSPDYKKDDIMIGHSYFLADDLDSLKIKLEYEIKPLLLEYLKDGIFISDEIEEKINQL